MTTPETAALKRIIDDLVSRYRSFKNLAFEDAQGTAPKRYKARQPVSATPFANVYKEPGTI